jgi:hypothetical protein
MNTDEAREQQPYESPKVEELPAEDGPAVTAAGKSMGDAPPGAEWQRGTGPGSPEPDA